MTTVALRRWFERPVGGSWGDDAGAGERDALCVRGTDLVFDQLDIDIGSAPLRSFSAEDIRRRSLRSGDIVIEKSGGGSTQPVGRVGLFRESLAAIPTNFAARLRPRSHVDPRFACYQLASLYFEGRTMAAVKQTTGIQNLDLEELLTNRAWLPPLGEQRTIADYLDAETARIDALIAKKQQLIHHLEERRRSHVDGLLWRGRVARLKFVAEVVPGYAFPSGDFSPGASGPRLLRGINVGVHELAWDEAVHLQGDGPPHRRYVLAEGDVVVGMDRPFISKGTRAAPVGPADAGALLVQRVCRLRPVGSTSIVLVAALSSPKFQAYVESDLTGVSVPHLSDEQIGNFEVPTDLSDSEISAIKDATYELGRAELLLKKQLDLLVEHRQALVAAVVSGAS